MQRTQWTTITFAIESTHNAGKNSGPEDIKHYKNIGNIVKDKNIIKTLGILFPGGKNQIQIQMQK